MIEQLRMRDDRLSHLAAKEIENLRRDYAALLERWKDEQKKRIALENRE